MYLKICFSFILVDLDLMVDFILNELVSNGELHTSALLVTLSFIFFCILFNNIILIIILLKSLIKNIFD